MIEFLQDYQTKALPPETFKDEQRAERSPESEDYFVRLGVAGYVVDGQLVDQDYRPITRRKTVPVVANDRRIGNTGRGGEVMGLDGPARASSGPGNAGMFMDDGTTAEHAGENPGAEAAEIERLRGLIEAGDEAFRKMDDSHLAEKAALQVEVRRLTDELTETQSMRDNLSGEIKVARDELAARDALIADLERQLADAPRAAKKTTASKAE